MNKHLLPVIVCCCSFAGMLNLVAQDRSNVSDLVAKKEHPFVIRPFTPVAKAFHGNGISYGPYRQDQRPGGAEPTKEQIREDMKLLAADNWQMIRTYGTEPFSELVCQVIQEEKLNIKVMIGAWLATEKDNSNQQKLNQTQVARAIKLANAYPEIVAAVSVANESQVFWSFHKVEQRTLMGYVRQVRASIRQPVTVADDFKYWKTDESKTVAGEIDFIVTHIYAMWLGEQLDNALPWTRQTYADVCRVHPNQLVVIGEGGWATKKSDKGEQSERIKGIAGEQEQKKFFLAYTKWLQGEKIPYFYFEAFDEPWKGGTDPSEVEKHWGLFREDRTRKPAIAR